MKFVGRENEMHALRKAWIKTLAGDQQVVVLIAESRLGKTRIVQEFYHWLNQQYDLSNYWPDSLPRDHDSLHVNPFFSEEHAGEKEPPWLWWGLRWLRPGLRNPGQFDRCAVVSGADHLAPHIECAMRLEQRRMAERVVLKSVGKTAVDLVSNVATAGMASAAISLWSHATEWLELRKHTQIDERSVFDRKEENTLRELDKLSALLLSMVGAGAIKSDGLPLVLVLDDVHWADAESLQFIQRLLRELQARSIGKSRFPVKLLIVATSWEREWVQASTKSLSEFCDSNPTSFSEVVRAIQRELPPGSPKQLQSTEFFLKRLDNDLEHAVAEALPGLTPEQCALIAGRAGGSPGLLVELIVKLTQRSRHLFEHSNVMGKLTPRGEVVLKDMSVDYHELVEERLQDLDNLESAVLRLASYQGATYSQKFVQELLNRSDMPPDPSASPTCYTVETVFRRADTPLALVQPIAEQVDEFRLPIYWEVLRRQLEETDSLWSCIEEHLSEQLEEWLDKARLASLPPEGRRTFLSFASRDAFERFSRSGQEQDRLILLKIWSEQLRDLEMEGRTAPLMELLESWLKVWRSGDRKELLAGLGSQRLLFVLRAMRVADRMVDCKAISAVGLELFPSPPPSDIASSMRGVLLHYAAHAAWETDCPIESIQHAKSAEAEATEDIRVYGETPERLGTLARAKHLLAAVSMYTGEEEVGIALFEESLALRERLLNDLGESAQRLRDVSESKADLALALHERDDNATAMNLLGEALGMLERIIAKFGDRIAWWQNIAEVQERLASVKVEVDQSEQAMKLLQQSLEIRERIVFDYGPSWDRFRTISIAKNKIGNLLMRRGEMESAYTLFAESVDICEQVLRKYGPNSVRIDDIRVAKFKAADALKKLDKADQALALYRETLAIAEATVGQDPSNAETLRSIYLSHFRIAEVLFERGELVEAGQAFEDALAMSERIIREYGSNYLRLRDVSLCKGKLAEGLLACNQVDAALKAAQEVLEMDERALKIFGASYMRLSDVAHTGVVLGDIYLQLGHLLDAQMAYRRSQEIEEQISRDLSPGPLHFKRLAICKNRIGNVLLLMNEQGKALKYFHEGLGYSQRIIDELGPDADRLRDLAVSKCRIGEVLIQQEELEPALALFMEALEAFEAIRAISGAWPQTLDDIMLTKGRMGDLYLALGDLGAAGRAFDESLEIAGKILGEFGETSKFLKRMALSKRRVAELLLRQQRGNDAIKLLQQALSMVEGLLGTEGTKHEHVIDVALIKDRLAEGFLLLGDLERAEREAGASMVVCGELVTGGCISMESIHELFVSRKRLGELFSNVGMAEMSARIFHAIGLSRSE